jgi:hypothetical protein
VDLIENIQAQYDNNLKIPPIAAGCKGGIVVIDVVRKCKVIANRHDLRGKFTRWVKKCFPHNTLKTLFNRDALSQIAG